MKKILTYIRHHYSEIYKAFLFIVCLLVIVVFLPVEGKFKYEFQSGKPWLHNDLIAPFDFAVQKTEEELAEETSEALGLLKPYYSYSDEVTAAQRSKLYDLLNDTLASGSGQLCLNEDCRKALIAVFDTIMAKGVIQSLSSEYDYLDDKDVILVRNRFASDVSPDAFLSVSDARNIVLEQLKDLESINAEVLHLVINNVIAPNVIHDSLKTIREKSDAVSGISRWRGMVQYGERVISKGELITPDKNRIILSLKNEMEGQSGTLMKRYAILLGQTILVVISLLVIWLFLLFFRKDIFNNNKKLVLILFQILLMVVITSLVLRFNSDYLYIIPLCMVPIIVRAFFDTRLALFVHVVSIINIGFLVPNSFEFVFMQLFTGIITIISIVKLYKRSQFFFTSVLIFLTYSVIYIALSLIHDGSLSGIEKTNFLLFAASGLLTLFASPIIYVYERIFGFITDVSLMEYSDTNNVLLRELANKAPGTFQHSIQVANLAEEAAIAVNANQMLARAGALYHDIGKMDMPAYFIENQSGSFNPHEELSYHESAALIISHVIKGVQKAKRFKIPEQIIDFIRTHHGTKKTDYFFGMQKRDFSAHEVNEEDFSYRGPIPFSKETCIVMMADAVEAATRSLKNPDENNVNSLVEQIIQKHFDEGQFMNANITLRDISRVKAIFKKRLLNIYHLRIEYPE